ncbi:aspartic protease [Aureimonas sp. SA4125]|uniref:retropepsin-like aspartic protease family protein n=1 Tax=Aureimonas sp. SA4125 TaxID=2826993 RepID=UPI001CC5DB5F|nr:TIGR02281 family clan AA aspartic protease [Aureimonas sp. SA4125]BDA85316.1 aspartic protease [Aureimonas sp. SA4125]
MRDNRLLLFLLAAIAVVVAFLVFNDDGTVAGIGEGQFADVAYLSVWVLVLASSMFFVFRGNLSGAVKSLAIYALGFVLLIGLYGYRAELREVGDRFLAELIPGRAIAIAGTDGRQFMVMRGDDEHFHVAAEVDGRPVEFLVDTGASVVALDRRAAAAIGIDVASLAYTSRVMTANGIARSAPVVLGTVRIGEIERANVQAVVMDRDDDGISLLGMSFLGTLSSFDFRGERLVLSD